MKTFNNIRKKTYEPKQIIWNILEEKKEASLLLERDLSLNPVVSRILANRGISSPDEVKDFLDTSLSTLLDPFLLKDMKIAVERITSALDKHEPILIYGDYDSDGITATVVLLKTLRWLEADPSPIFYIPHRIHEGYGLNYKAIETFVSQRIKLIITVDTGISSIEEVKYANEKGIDVIITDHHQPPDPLPPALAIINPNQKDCSYPQNYLSGVGIAFKLAHALLKHRAENQKIAKQFLLSLMDIVALGTIADMVPMIGENRAIVKYGLEKLVQTDKIGLSMMLENIGIDDRQPLTPDKIGYFIAPRLNVAGRTEHANICVELLLCDDSYAGVKIAHYLENLNNFRRSIEQDIIKEARCKIEKELDLENEKIIVVVGDNWHLGVIGIVASKLVEFYNRPVVIFSKEHNIAKGSARSINGFNIFNALSHCKDFLITYGGHTMAAGLQINHSLIDQFREEINNYAINHIRPDLMHIYISIDTYLKGEEINKNTIKALSKLGPFGQSNPHPLFIAENVRCATPPRIVGENHLKMKLEIDNCIIDAIGFSMGDFYKPLLEENYKSFDIVFLPFINDWMGNKKVEIELKDIRFF